MVKRIIGVLGWIMAIASAQPATAGTACQDILPRVTAPSQKRPVTNRDVIQLRDIGSLEGEISDAPPQLAASPNGREIAFVVSRADVADNSYCRALIVVSVATGRARIVDRGGELITLVTDRRGSITDNGTPAGVAPVWSDDGRHIFYQKKLRGLVEAWDVDLVRHRAGPAARVTFDVESIDRPAGSRSLVITGRPDMPRAIAAITANERRGWAYDDHLVPGGSARPRVATSAVPLVTYRLDPRARTLVRAEVQPTPMPLNKFVLAAPATAVRKDGWSARIAVQAGVFVAPDEILVKAPDGRELKCTDPSCTGWLTGIWWEPGGAGLLYMKREGWARELTALYRWAPGTRTPDRLLTSTDAIQNCALASRALVCTSESATVPRRVVAIDVRDGQERELFDPNPEFAHLRLGTVRRLYWRNNLGLPAWGDLVLPPDYRPGTKLPMVVVQYFSRGFLRAGTNAEYPIFPLAARGYAVLQVQRPSSLPNEKGVTRLNDLVAADYRNWADLRSSLSSLEKGVAAAERTGDIDPSKVGITGLSDGAAVARFSLINTHLFAAAAISGCCMDPVSYLAYGGTAFADELHQSGFPPFGDRQRSFWGPVSLAENADGVATPILIQSSDEEYLLGLEGYAALRAQDRPVALYVFAGEHHGKSQPAHKWYVAERADDWFDFWLRDRVDPAPEKMDQFRFWQGLRAKAAARSAAIRDHQVLSHASASTNLSSR